MCSDAIQHCKNAIIREFLKPKKLAFLPKEWVVRTCSSENASIFGSEKHLDLSFFVEKSPSPVFLIFVCAFKRLKQKKLQVAIFLTRGKNIAKDVKLW